MTNAQVTDQGTISLDGFYYRLKGEVRSFSAGRYAQRISIGATDLTAHEDISYLRWDNFTGGIGLFEFTSDGGEAPKRIWFGDANLSNDKHLTLGPLVTKTPVVVGATWNDDIAGADDPVLAIFENAVYQMVRNIVGGSERTRIYKLSTADPPVWDEKHVLNVGSVDFNMNADMIVGPVGLASASAVTDYIIACAGNDYAYSSDGSSWMNDSDNAHRLAIHDNALWALERDGLFHLETTIGTRAAKAQLAVPATAANTDISYISDLVAIPDSNGDSTLHAGTAFGLFIYDQSGDKWVKSQLTFPEARYNCRGVNLWNGDIYIPTGMGLSRVIYGSELQVLPVGPDRDHGLPPIHRGAITDLAPGHSMLAVGLSGEFPGFRHYNSTVADLRALVMAYDGLGWQVLFKSTTESERVHKVIIGSAYDEYRLWFSTSTTNAGRDVYYIDLQSEKVDPHQTTSQTFAASSQIETPWFRIGQDVEGIAVSVLVDAHGTSSTETVKTEYEVGYSGTYNDLGTLTGDLNFEYQLPSSADPVGVVFQAIRFRITLARGGTTTDRPFLHSLTLKFLKLLQDRQTHVLTVDLSEDVGGQSPRDQWGNLRNALRKRNLLEFTFRDDPSLGSEDRFFVRIKNSQSILDTGRDYRGEITLELVEVQHISGGHWDIDSWNQMQWS